jgi:hypothetical protein
MSVARSVLASRRPSRPGAAIANAVANAIGVRVRNLFRLPRIVYWPRWPGKEARPDE